METVSDWSQALVWVCVIAPFIVSYLIYLWLRKKLAILLREIGYR